MAKLWKEAGRVKTILSANSDAMSTVSCMIEDLNCGAHGHQVEGVAFDIDFKAKVTRAQFEDVCKDLHPRFSRPIHDALAIAGIPLVFIVLHYLENIS
jgi:hypoxia up-regulated 1